MKVSESTLRDVLGDGISGCFGLDIGLLCLNFADTRESFIIPGIIIIILVALSRIFDLKKRLSLKGLIYIQIFVSILLPVIYFRQEITNLVNMFIDKIKIKHEQPPVNFT